MSEKSRESQWLERLSWLLKRKQRGLATLEKNLNGRPTRIAALRALIHFLESGSLSEVLTLLEEKQLVALIWVIFAIDNDQKQFVERLTVALKAEGSLVADRGVALLYAFFG